jgi:hypothetical protein
MASPMYYQEEMSKPTQSRKPLEPTSSQSENEVFRQALASVLSASPARIRESREQAKAEKPSSHTRYKYDPAKGHL